MEFRSFIREIANFPKQGVEYKDITPLLMNPDAMRQVVDVLVDRLPHQNIDKVVGIESRGFFFATLLAQRLGAGFVPVRKPGKLPYKTHAQTYQLEYGIDTLEIHEDAIKEGEKVLLHDDVLATGGTADAASRLIEKCGGEIVQCNFLVELQFLEGMKKLNRYNTFSLIEYS